MARHDQIARTLAIAHALASARRGVVARTLAERHGWKLRSVYRDIDALEKAGFPVVHEDGRYRLLDGWAPPSSAGIDADEALALFAARQLAGAWKGTTLGRALDRLWAKLVPGGRGQTSLVPPGAPWLTVRAPAGIDYAQHQKTLAVIEKAIRERRVVSCRYQALSTPARGLDACDRNSLRR